MISHDGKDYVTRISKQVSLSMRDSRSSSSSPSAWKGRKFNLYNPSVHGVLVYETRIVGKLPR